MSVLQSKYDLLTTYPDVAKQWHPTKNGSKKPEEYRPGHFGFGGWTVASPGLAGHAGRDPRARAAVGLHGGDGPRHLPGDPALDRSAEFHGGGEGCPRPAVGCADPRTRG